MGKRLAESGYSLLVVNPFYRTKKAPTAPNGAAIAVYNEPLKTKAGFMPRVVLVTLLCLSTSVLAQQAQVPPPQPLTIDGAVTHVYKTVGGVELRLHVFAPAGSAAAPRPAIVFFFGGGWRNGSVMQFVPQSKHLSERGMVAIVADYRVFGRHQTMATAAVADAKSAMRWVRAHAKELRIDPARIAAGGGSAGGHLAAATATIDAFDEPSEDLKISSRPNALVLFNPSLDTSGESLSERFGGKGRDASPVHHVRAGLPRTVIFHGKADTTVPYASVERYCETAKKAGNECQLFGYEGATHGFFNRGRDGDKWYEETVREMDRFLTTIGYLAPALADYHQHLFSADAAELVLGKPGSPGITARDLIALLDAAGIRRALVLSMAYTWGKASRAAVDDEYTHAKAENDWTAEQVAQYPDRLRAFCSFNPLKPYAMDELTRCHNHPQLRHGLKLHFGNSDVDLDNAQNVAQVRKVFEAANRFRMAIVVHMRTSIDNKRRYGAEQARVFLNELLPAAPDVPVQIAHLVGSGGYDATIEAAAGVFAEAAAKRDPRLKNVWYDASGVVRPAMTPDQLKQIAGRIRELGIDRVLYGSDAAVTPAFYPKAAWEAFQRLPLTEGEFTAMTANIPPYMRDWP